MNLTQVQSYLREQGYDGWLLYNFRDLNPIAQSVVGLAHGGSRRWFCWIPAQGQPSWLIHAIEGNMFADLPPEIQGSQTRYVSWQEMAEALPGLIGVSKGRRPKIVMEYSPGNAIPFISRIDAGIKEVVEASTGAEIHSSADVAQLVLAVLSPKQIATHRRAATACLEAKDRCFDLIARKLRAGEAITEYDAAQFVAQQFTALGMEAHMPIVSVNANAADPHYGPSANRHSPIREGDMVLIDLWSREPDDPTNCFADCTWTAYAGSDVPGKVQDVFQVVATARDAAVRYIQAQLDAGRTVHGNEVDTVARDIITDAGYGEYFIHRTGHSLGPTGHYLGVNIDNLETQDQRVLLPGVMFTIEPGIYMPAFNFDDSPTAKGLGIRSEINCYMHADRVEVTTLPTQTEVRPLLA
ncbi:MAG: aminopeptidase P family protein [Caldilineaceae bacterium]|nr:aminopeptidase P family protein [Caldilineaceae bacterium]